MRTMKRRRDPYDDDSWLSRESRQMLSIGLPVILVLALVLYFVAGRG